MSDKKLNASLPQRHASALPPRPAAALPHRAAYSLPYEEIREAVEKIQYGTVQLIIQDGRIVQIDTTEKKRLV